MLIVKARKHWRKTSAISRRNYAIPTHPLLAFASLEGATQIGLILFCVASIMVTKASTVVIVTCRWRFSLNICNKRRQCKHTFSSLICAFT